MHANKAVVALIASLAAAATLLPAGSALAAGTDTKGPAARGNTVVNTGRATLSTPKVNKTTVPKRSSTSHTAPTDSANASLTEACYVYSNGSGDLCLWSLQNFSGSRGGVYYSDPNLWDNYFATPAPGQGLPMANKSGTACNYDSYYTAILYTGVNYTGYSLSLSPHTCVNLVWPFLNNVKSVGWR